MSAIHHIHVTLHHLTPPPWNKSSPQRRRSQGVKNINTEHNAPSLDVFKLLFYQLLEICYMCVAVRGMSLKEKTILFYFHVYLYLKYLYWNCIV